MQVEFIRFHPPDGYSIDYIGLPDDLEAKVKAVEAAGCRLTMELLSTGLVSMCIEHPAAGDFDTELIRDGPLVPIQAEALIRRFDSNRFQTWLGFNTKQ